MFIASVDSCMDNIVGQQSRQFGRIVDVWLTRLFHHLGYISLGEVTNVVLARIAGDAHLLQSLATLSHISIDVE